MLARLCASSHPAAAWAEGVEPWLRAHGAAWRETRVVLAPNAVWLAALKAGAVAAGLPILGLQWHTPGRWRTQALAALPGPRCQVALREDLHLLLELAAQGLPANPLARAYGGDPALFQELLDTLEGAGWDAEVLPDAPARELARAAAQLRAQTGWLTAAAADQKLRAAAAAGTLPPLGRRLLAVGFGLGDQALDSLLETAVHAGGESTVLLDVAENTVERDLASAAWLGRWEERLGDAATWLEAPAATPAPFAALAAQVADPAMAASAKNAPPIFWLAENLQAEADLATTQALAFLGEDAHARVGIVVGSVASPLAREVAARLTALGCPHYDATGHLPGRENAQALFEAWLDWQEDGRLAGLMGWVRAAGRHGWLGEKSVAAIEAALHDAAQALLTDDPVVLAAWLQSGPMENFEARDFLATWPRLPEATTWDGFLQKILAVSQQLRWPAEPAALEERAQGWREQPAFNLPRAAVVRWVRAVTRVPGRTRAAMGREPWARLQIVDAAAAAAQMWTHLVLGGLQHGEWPAERRDSPLLDDAQVEKLNRQAMRPSSHGEGDWMLAPGHSLLLASRDARRLERANFARLLALPSQGLALTARLADAADGRRARLSEYFWSVARAAWGRLPAEADWLALAKISSERRAGLAEEFGGVAAKSLREKSLAAPDARQTAWAHQARRDADTVFDDYSFCLRAAPSAPLRLSCKAWDRALRQPGAAWFEHILRAEPLWQPAEDDAVQLSIGQWAHTWARPGPENSTESFLLPNAETWRKFSLDAAQQFRRQAQAAFTAAGRAVPEAWLDAHAEATRLAGQWITALADLPGWPHALAETKLPRGLPVALPGVAQSIPLSGRMDLVLFPRGVSLATEKLGGSPAWLFDFKTGADDKLTIKKLSQGRGLQLALYALALRALGAGVVELTLLNPAAEPQPQLTDADFAAPELAGCWQLLADFAVRGQWGERCDLEDEHARPGHYPSATLPVPVDILERKWQLTHGTPA